MTLSDELCKIPGTQQVQLAYIVIIIQTHTSDFSEIFQCAQDEKLCSNSQEGAFHNHVLLGVGLRSLVMRTNQENIRKYSTD